MADSVDLFQVPRLCPNRHLHDECRGSRSPPVPQTDQNQGWLSHRKQFAEAALCWHTQGIRALDASNSKLESDALATEHPLSRSVGAVPQPMTLTQNFEPPP